MAKQINGIFGGYTGTLGNRIGYCRNGNNYIRTKPKSVNDVKTKAQQNQRSRFTLIVQLMKKIKPIIDIGFRNSRGDTSPMNKAISVNLRNAITGSYPNLKINPEALVIASGNLTGCYGASMQFTYKTAASIHWYNEPVGNASNEDKVMALLYNTNKNEVVCSPDGARRQDENLQLSLPKTWIGDTIAGYIAFYSKENRSDTNYLGIKKL